MNKELFLKENCPDRRGTNCSKWDILKNKYGDSNLLSMWVADMDFKAPREVIEVLKKKVEFGVFGYSITREEYYSAFINWEKENHNWEIKKDWIRFTPGVVTGIFWCVNLFTEKGDSVIINMPVYYPFHTAIKDLDRNLIYSELVNKEGRYTIDFEDFEKKIIDNNVRLYILCSPHNPVGRVWKEEELDKLLSICKKHGVIVISDEIHHDLVLWDNKHIPSGIVSNGRYSDIIITLTAASKTFNLAGMKNSFVIISNEDLRKKFDDYIKILHEDTGNMLGYYAVETAYTYGKEWLKIVLEIIQDNYNYLKNRLNKELPFAILTPLEGTYLAWLDLSAYTGKVKEEGMKDFVQNKARLAIDYGNWFGVGGDGFIRLNLATLPGNIKRAVDGLVKAANN